VGDGFVATFDSPSRAIECARAIRETLKVSDIGVRAARHTGEIEARGNDVAGMAVHIGARVSALANPGEVLMSSADAAMVEHHCTQVKGNAKGNSPVREISSRGR
jgi:class 3 adenylate cyclase